MTRESPIGSVLVVAGFIGLVGLIASGFMLRDAWRDRSGGAEAPQPLTLGELLTRGPGGNNHVAVSRFVIANEYVRSRGGSAETSFLVLTPQDPTPPGVGTYLVVEVPEEAASARADAVARQETITGVYSTEIGSSSREGRRLLEEKNPGLDVWSAPSLEVRARRGVWYAQRLIVLAGVSGATFLTAVLGLVWFVRRVKRDERRAAELIAREPGNRDRAEPGAAPDPAT